MGRKRTSRNDKDAHHNIAKDSPTWREVVKYCLAVIARASAQLADPGTPMVDMRTAQGDRRTALGLLKLANPEFQPIEPDVPELYPTGGPED